MEEEGIEPEEPFRMKDIWLIITNKGFWLIAMLCVLFYSAVFPFLKYATDLMVQKYHVDPELAGTIPSLLPLGTLFLTPFFGNIYDRIGKGATLMIIGSILLIFVHTMFALPILNIWWFATVVMIVLGIGFSLVPSAMWPLCLKLFLKNNWVLLMLLFLGTELGIDGCSCFDWLCAEQILQGAGCRWYADL